MSDVIDAAAATPPGDAARGGSGILPSQAIRALMDEGVIAADTPLLADQVQPDSLDLRLGPIAYRVRASFLPGRGAPVIDKVHELGMHEIDLSGGAVLERGCVYIVPLMERLRLEPRLSAFANPKSSTGRLDVFTRLITDGGAEFDRIERGYSGPLYAEVAPRAFSIVVRAGSRLNQLRLRRGAPSSSASGLRRLQASIGLVDRAADAVTMRDDSIAVSLDLRGEPGSGLIGYSAKKHTDVIDVDLRDHYDPLDYWDPILARPGRGIVLNPDDFYILRTKESVTVPPDHAAEMVAYDTLVGEFRVHYAGFFDPGFGYGGAEGQGSKAVLEVRSHDVPFLLEHEQIIGWLRYERLTAAPDRVYGPAIGSTYQGQGLALSKQFKRG